MPISLRDMPEGKAFLFRREIVPKVQPFLHLLGRPELVMSYKDCLWCQYADAIWKMGIGIIVPDEVLPITKEPLFCPACFVNMDDMGFVGEEISCELIVLHIRCRHRL